MLKIRLQGTTKDIKWFVKILSRDKRFVINTPSDPQNITGTQKYKRVYTEIYRDKGEYERHKKYTERNNRTRYYDTGVVFGSSKNDSDY